MTDPQLPIIEADKPAARRQPAGAKAQRRVAEILRVGREVFSEKGYERATTIEMAQRLGISEATVFSYFSGKREICLRVIDDWYDEIIHAIRSGMPREASIRQQFGFFVRAHLRLFLLNGTGLCALVLSEGRAKSQDFGDAFVNLQRRYTAPLMELLAAGQAIGQVRSDVPLRLLRSMVLGPIEHVLWDAIRATRVVDIDATAEQLVTILWATLQPPDIAAAALRDFHHDVDAANRRLQQQLASRVAD